MTYYFELKSPEKQQTQGEAFFENPLSHLKTGPPECPQLSCPLGSPSTREEGLVSQERRPEVDTALRLCHKGSHHPSILPRAPSSFLKIIYSLLRRQIPTPLTLLGQHISLNSKPSWGVTHFLLGSSHTYMRQTY